MKKKDFKRRIVRVAMMLFALVTTTQVWAQTTMTWTFSYTGAIQIFTAPKAGIYELQVWGAQGGNRGLGGGLGGYATCRTLLTEGETIYVYIGGQGGAGSTPAGGAGGWNGGGKGGTGYGYLNGSAGGGGATHISKVNNQVIGSGSGQCASLVGTNYIIVAGGGGGAGFPEYAGAGGGTEGGLGILCGDLHPTYSDHFYYSESQSYGADGGNGNDGGWNCEGAGGGGGGYYGGTASYPYSTFPINVYANASGCGGNSAYNIDYATDFSTTAGQREGNGQAQITLLVSQEAWATGELTGLFSVSSTKQVRFSQGNLQAVCTSADNDVSTQESWTWRFATNQYDYIGYAAANNAINGNGSVSAAGTVDLFGWSTSSTYYGINNSSNDSDYSGDFRDWGNLAISNGGNTANSGWRTLTRDEWAYLFTNHTYGYATVAGVKGIIITPDNYSGPAIDSNHSDDTNPFARNTIDASTWTSTYVSAGVIFLPAAGFRIPWIGQVQENAYYWTSTPVNGTNKYATLLGKPSNGAIITYSSGGNWGANDGFSVRLVKDVTKNEVTLADGTDLSASGLTSYTGKECDVTYTRAFTSGKTSTVCLPFAYTKQEGDGSFYAFTNIKKENGEYVATMTEPVSPTLTANTPYLFTPATSSVTFTGTIASVPASFGECTTTSNGWTFKGTYETIQWTEAPTGTYGFSAQNVDAQGISQGEFVKVGAYVRVKPMRCYLENESFAGARGMNRAAADEPLPETISVRLVSANGDLNAIGTLHTQTGEVTLDGWYTLDGTRLSGQPTRKGIYVNNGKKVIF